MSLLVSHVDKSFKKSQLCSSPCITSRTACSQKLHWCTLDICHVEKCLVMQCLYTI